MASRPAARALGLGVVLAFSACDPGPPVPQRPKPEAPLDAKAASEVVATPDTPAGRRLASIVDFLGSWDGAPQVAEAFVHQTLGPAFLEVLGNWERDHGGGRDREP